MNRIKEALTNGQGPVLNIYFTAGYPELDSTGELIRALADCGVDLIEIGMPYSDPMADGPTIQQSSSVALKNGMTLETMFGQVRQAAADVDIPLILMGYLNQMMQFGEERFLQTCQENGISGLIIPDLPPELYASQYRELFDRFDMAIIFLITPQTSEERIRKIDELSDSFIYVVSDSSITGKTKDISQDQLAYFNRIQKMKLRNPTLIGFGISDHQGFQQAATYSSGAIIGSAFIKELTRNHGKQPAGDTVRDFVDSIRNNK